MRTAAILGGAAVIAAGLLAAAVVIAGGGDSGGPPVTAAAKQAGSSGHSQPSEGRGSVPSAKLPPNSTPCGSGAYVEERRPGQPYTSCPFALEVSHAYYESGGSSSISAYSPVTGRLYAMTCSGADPVLCTDARSARVYLTPTEPAAPSAEGSASSSSTGLGDWPGGEGYSAMLGAFSSEWRARNFQSEVVERGLEAGVLYSSSFSSLKPGYWVVFSGDFASSTEAAMRAHAARSIGYSDSYPRLVSP